jgi:nucleoside 2-deoxyribosyltransferase
MRGEPQLQIIDTLRTRGRITADEAVLIIGRKISTMRKVAAKRLIVYVASPLGFTASTRAYLKKHLIPKIRTAGVTTINPWDSGPEIKKLHEDIQKTKNLDLRRNKWEFFVQKLGKANANSIERADGIVAVLEGTDVDSGTAAEIGYGVGLGKWVIGYREDFRRTGEDETAEVNLQVEYFVTKSGGIVAHTVTELQNALRKKTRSKRN